MSEPLRDASRWVYRGVWSILLRWFHVPGEPPTLPVPSGERLESFAPSENWLRYLKLNFWILFVLQKSLWLALCVALIIAVPLVGLLLTLPFLAILSLLAMMMYLALHLRFDTTRYVMSSKSMRIRRGIWVIHETTITFENIQNVSVSQGPLQRYFGIADVVVQTAGGGGHGGGQPGHGGNMGAHFGLIEGIGNAQEVRDRILKQLMQSRSAGLGDEPASSRRGLAMPARGWQADQVALLRDIRDAVAELARA
ncbi:MAG: PH domain-containing protein [Planctomycetes bacterium]|nr:PH domain-containing protein [Planctomycetota bacterium]